MAASAIVPRPASVSHRRARALAPLAALALLGGADAALAAPAAYGVYPVNAPTVVNAMNVANIDAVANASRAAAPDGAHGAQGAQDINLLRRAAGDFLRQQTEGLPGKVTIALAQSSPHGLAACAALDPFIPPGVRLWGRAMIGVRCNGERPWTIYLQARIGVIGNYYVAAKTLNAGDTIGMQDLIVHQGDLTTLPAAIVTDPAQAVGAVAMNRVSAGFPLRADLIRTALTIRFGQAVKVIARGDGFAVSSEGSALTNASVGQPVRVRIASGVVVSGIAREDASVDIPL